MRILYSATDQRVPGTKGGGVHVLAVASGLAALGHEVHVATGRGHGPWPDAAVHWHDLETPMARPQWRLLTARVIGHLARAIRPDVVIERYHNFGGEGLLAARACGVPAVLEVNAPVVDYEGSPKRILDRLTLVEPMRRWRDWQCRQAALIVTPTRTILPAWTEPERVLELEWGADVSRFHPGAAGDVPYSRSVDEIVALFAGAFRPWHGAHILADALKQLEPQGDRRFRGVFIGDGPELARVRAIANGLPRVVFTGAIPHSAMPAALAAADIGVAPFDVGAHPPLSIAFYWSPLKVFEYMASGLPVVAPRIPRLSSLVNDGREGVLYDPPTADTLARALQSLAPAEHRAALGRAARARVERDFSWAAHCAALDAALARIVTRAPALGR